MLAYVDTSALVKLVIEEVETQELAASLPGLTTLSSVLAAPELHRAVRRHPLVDLHVLRRVDDVLERIRLMSMTADILHRARSLEPTMLRTLDALHVSTALTLGSRLDVLVTYDLRMGQAAAVNGLHVISPGASLA